MSAFQLVVCDLDGTLVHHDLSVSSAVRQTISEILTLPDVRFVLATGRMHPSAVIYANLLGVREPVISYQGAMARGLQATEPPIFHQPVPDEAGRGIAQLCHEQGFHVNVYVNDTLSSNPHPVYVEEYRRTSRVDMQVVPDVRRLLDGAASTKMVVIENDPQRLDDIRTLIQQGYGAQVDVCLSRPNFLEVTAQGVNKWSAVRALADRWEIPTEAILCIGDQENDASMLQHAGCGVAMGNALLSVQQLANRVVPTLEQDGAAVAMSELILGRPLALVSAS